MKRKKLLFTTFVLLLIIFESLAQNRTLVKGGVFDCFWGGRNEETSYTTPYTPGMGGMTLSQLPSPPINLGAPPPAQSVPVQATPNTQAVSVPQALIPTITVPTGAVGSVGRPATQPITTTSLQQIPPGTEIMYVLPEKNGEDECLDGVRGTPATASKVVPAGTPGAIPVAVKTVNVLKPKVEYRWTYSPIRTKTERLVKVVSPKTGRVVQTYCETDEEQSFLPYLHREEVVTYETVAAKVGTPVSLTPAASTNTWINNKDNSNQAIVSPPSPSTPPPTGAWQSRYPNAYFPTPAESTVISTVVIP